MNPKTKLKMFEHNQVRSVWNENQGKWFFSVVDVIAILTESNNPQVYWRVLKKRLIQEGNQTVTNCNGLKFNVPVKKKYFSFEYK